MADYIGATPQVNPLMGLLAERLKQAQQFAAKPFGYSNPPAEMLMNLLGVPAVQQTAERLAYGEPMTTGRGMTTQVRPEVMEAAMTVAPAAGLLGKATKGMPVGLSIKPMDDVESLLSSFQAPKSFSLLQTLNNENPARVDQLIKSRTRNDLFDYEIRLMDVKSIKPSQFGEDFINDSSKYTAQKIKNATNVDDIRKEDLLPIKIDSDGNIIDGNHRYAAALMNNERLTPVLFPVKKGKGEILNLDFLEK
jgi:hypothetical protein